MSAPAAGVSVVIVAGDAAELAAALAGVPSPDAGAPVVEVVVVHPPALSALLPAGVRSVVLSPADAGRARAHGMRAAGGRAVVFLGPGDRLLPGALAAGLAALDEQPDCAFVHGRVRVHTGGRPGNDESLLTRVVHVDHYVELLRGNVVGPSCAVLFRRSALLDAGLADAPAAALGDYALCLRLARRGPARFLDQPVAESTRAGEDAATELAALRAQRRHVRGVPSAVAAHRAGMTALVARAAVLAAGRVRSSGRPMSLLRHAAWFARLLLVSPRGVAALVSSELLPWAARRRPGSRLLQAVAGGSAARVPGLVPAARLAKVVRYSTPPAAPVAVLGRPDPALDLGDRAIRFVPPPAWSGAAPEEFLLVPGTSSWEQSRLGTPDLSGWEAVWSDPAGALYRSRAADPGTGRVLVAGYFSFEDAHATAGDLLVRDHVCDWLTQAGRPFDVAHAAPFVGGVDWRTVDPARYSDVIFACGPFSPDIPSWKLLERFPTARSVGVNLSMLAPLDVWNPFDVLIERDSSRRARPDVAFATAAPRVPVVGICLREQAPGTRTADAAIRRLVASTPMAAVRIDTRLDVLQAGTNSTGQRTAAEVESLLARMDVVVTTRLHGLVLALKNGVPVVAVDPGNEGYKIRRQAESVGWPVVFTADEADDDALRSALEFCCSAEARTLAAACAARAVAAGDAVHAMFETELVQAPAGTGN